MFGRVEKRVEGRKLEEGFWRGKGNFWLFGKEEIEKERNKKSEGPPNFNSSNFGKKSRWKTLPK